MLQFDRRARSVLSIHRKVNTLLTVLAVALGLYITSSPVIPQIGWWLQHHNDTYASTVVNNNSPISSSKPIPQENFLVIPRLTMHETIHTGMSIAELRKGTWLVPFTSSPDKASNTVIVGHRFTYAGPAVFYFLDKIQLHDQIIVDWESMEYTYVVTSIKEVPPTDLSVEQPTPKPQLTLYTCTPLWTATNRLVIVATLDGVRK